MADCIHDPVCRSTSGDVTTASGELEDAVKERDLNTRLQEAIIDADAVLGAIAEAKQRQPRGRRGPLDLLEGEPALHEFLKGALLEIAGEMAINDCPPAMTRAVYRETAFLLAVTFNAVRYAHRDLYADLLPQAEADVAEAKPQADQDLSPGQDGGNEANRSSKKKEPKP